MLAVKVDADIACLLDHRVRHIEEVNGPDDEDADHDHCMMNDDRHVQEVNSSEYSK